VLPRDSSYLRRHTAVLELVRAGEIGLVDSTSKRRAAVSCVGGDVLIEVDVFVELAGLDRRLVGEFDQGGVGVGKVSDSHGLLLHNSIPSSFARSISGDHSRNRRSLITIG
jgi:hypothetical protein